VPGRNRIKEGIVTTIEPPPPSDWMTLADERETKWHGGAS
jgi:hypothetical protein